MQAFAGLQNIGQKADTESRQDVPVVLWDLNEHGELQEELHGRLRNDVNDDVDGVGGGVTSGVHTEERPLEDVGGDAGEIASNSVGVDGGASGDDVARGHGGGVEI